MRYDFTDCQGSKKHTANVFFYYPSSYNCDMSRSDPLPQFLTDVPCTHLCETNGTYTTFKVNENNEAKMVCEPCAADEIALRSGFILQPSLMFNSNQRRFPDKNDKFQRRFKNLCQTIDMTDTDLPRGERTYVDC